LASGGTAKKRKITKIEKKGYQKIIRKWGKYNFIQKQICNS
jgi:hypothetical protein